MFVLYPDVSAQNVKQKHLKSTKNELSEPEFYGDLIVGSNKCSAQFIKIISHYKKIGYNINV